VEVETHETAGLAGLALVIVVLIGEQIDVLTDNKGRMDLRALLECENLFDIPFSAVLGHPYHAAAVTVPAREKDEILSHLGRKRNRDLVEIGIRFPENFAGGRLDADGGALVEITVPLCRDKDGLLDA